MITFSEIVEDRVQIAGRRDVTEHHALDDGTVLRVNYLAEKNDDVEARMMARVPELEADLERVAAGEQGAGLRRSADEKISAYIDALSDKEKQDILSLDPAEIAVLNTDAAAELDG